MASGFDTGVQDVRKLAARGDYSAARKRVAELVDGAQGQLRPELEKQGRTLEVLESVDVVRRLLRDGDTGAAAKASTTILDALSSDEYARLGVVAAALTLLGRAGELARKVEGGDRSANTREELDAFVEYLGTELNQLGRDSVDRPLEAALDPAAARGGYTLGDMLSQRPWHPLTASEPRQQATGRADAASFRTDAASPVIGRILIEQEERERVAAMPQTQTSGAGAQKDVFDLVGRAALEGWWVVLATALIFAAFGYLAMAVSSDRYESSALLQKTPTSSLRAPVTGETTEYVPSLPSKTVLELVKLPTFHQRVSNRLAETGWGPGENPKPEDIKKRSVKPEEIANALSVAVTETGRDAYLIEFKAIYNNEEIAQAIAGAAAAEFRAYHYEHVTREATLNLVDYEARKVRIKEDLDKIYEKRLAEFATGDVEAIGVDIESRTKGLVKSIQDARAELVQRKIDLSAAREELDTKTATAERLPEFELPQLNARIEGRRAFLQELERELYELARKRNNFGPDHPIQERIKELQEDIDLVDAEIKELEKGSPDDLDQRRPNPTRAMAEDRVAEARSRVSIANDRVTYLEAHIPKLEAELEDLRGDYLASEALRRDETDLTRAKERTDVVIEELVSVKSSADRELALVSPAATAQKVERETLVGIAVGLVLGLVVGIGIAIGLLRRRQVRAASTI